MKLNIFIMIYVVLIIVIALFRLLSYYFKNDIVLKREDYNYVLISSLLYIILLYYLKSYVSITNIDYIIPIGICYISWYIITKFILNIIDNTILK